jgi:hypothetical protein
MFEKGRKYMTATVLLVLFAAGFAAALRPGIVIVKDTGELYVPTPPTETPTENAVAQQPIGGQTDSHGCLVAAGFAWNATSASCMRPFSGEVQLSSGTMMVNVSDPNWREKLQITVPISTDVKCVDTDGGSIYVAGKVIEKGKNPQIDTCKNSRLKEWSCVKDIATSEYVRCEHGCKDGACISNVTAIVEQPRETKPPMKVGQRIETGDWFVDLHPLIIFPHRTIVEKSTPVETTPVKNNVANIAE